MAHLTEKVEFHRMELARIIQLHGLGKTPAVLRSGRDPWLPKEAWAKLDEHLDEQLRSKGLSDGRDLSPAFEDALAAVAAPESGMYAYINHQQVGTYSLHLGQLGEDAAIIDVQNDQATLWSVESDRLASSFLQEFPKGDHGSGRAYTFPESAAPWHLDDEGNLPGGYRAPHESRQAALVLDAERDGAAVVYGVGRNGRADVDPLRMFWTTESGLWTITTDHSGSEPFVTLAPATLTSLTAAFNALLEAAERS